MRAHHFGAMEASTPVRKFKDVDPAVRKRMQRNRRSDTKPEMIVRRLAHRLGYRFRLHRKDLPGTPDLVFPSRRKVIMVHGCFWHQHPGCKLAKLPRLRPEYWLPKLKRNVERDARNLEHLRREGWTPHVVWECETRTPDTLSKTVTAFLDGKE